MSILSGLFWYYRPLLFTQKKISHYLFSHTSFPSLFRKKDNRSRLVKHAFFIVSLIVLLPNTGLTAKAKKPVYAAYILDDASGKVFHKKNETTITHPASLTKVMTLYMLFEALRTKKVTMNTKMKVSKHASQQKPSKLWLKPGSTIQVKDAVMALTVKSANDVSVVVAEHLGGTEAQFADLMTKKARQLGARNTTYKTASGLPNRKEVTTAKDQAIIFRALHRHFPRYWRYFKHKSFFFRGQKHPTHSRILNMCPGVDGLKTGFINASGFNLVASAKREDTRLFAVVMGGETSLWRDKRITNLINRYFPKAIELTKERQKKHKKSTKNMTLFVKNLVIPEKPYFDNGQHDVVESQTNKPIILAQNDTKSEKTHNAILNTTSQEDTNGLEPTNVNDPDDVFQALINQKPSQSSSKKSSSQKPPTQHTPEPLLTAQSNDKPTHRAATTASSGSFEFVPPKDEDDESDSLAQASTPEDLSPDESDAESTFNDGLPSQMDSEILSNIIANESYDDLEALSRRDRHWAAQFGAYNEEDEAQNRLNEIMDLIPDLPGEADISEAKNRRTPLFRARLINLSKDQAEQICKKMRFHDISCLPLKN